MQASKPTQPSRGFPNLSFSRTLPLSVLLIFNSFSTLPLLLSRHLGGESIGPSLGSARRLMVSSLELLQLTQKLSALLRGQILSPLTDEHLNIQGHFVDLTGLSHQSRLEVLKRKYKKKRGK